MQENPFLRKIMAFYKSYRLLSYLLLLHLILFIWGQVPFYMAGYFLFVLFLGGTLAFAAGREKFLITTYLVGAVVGGLTFTIWQNKGFDIKDTLLLIAILQSGILAILSAVTTYTPTFKIRLFTFSVRLTIVCLVLVVVNLLSVDKPALYLAHLAAVASGLLYGFVLRMGEVRGWKKIFSFLYRRKPRMKATRNPSRPLDDDTYNSIKVENQKKIDAILDKISKSGYDSLSKDEKALLFSSSK